MKQENNRDCVAAVAAMATETTLAQFKFEVDEHSDGGYSDIDFIAYCARHGVLVGGMAYGPDDDLITEAVAQGYLKIMIDQPEYVGCQSERFPGKEHALYWDGKKVWDPNPDVLDGRPLPEYKINFWWPLLKSSDGAKYLANRIGIQAK